MSLADDGGNDHRSTRRLKAATTQLDHVALQVPSIDTALELFAGLLGMTLKRTGVRHATGGRFVLLSDDHGVKLELVQEASPDTALLHLAYRVNDVASSYQQLLDAGCTPVRKPLWLDSAKADFATVRHACGLEIQLVNYAPDSPDA